MASNRIEILFIIDYFHRTGGTEKHLAQLIAGLPTDAFRCSVVAFDLGANPLLDGLRARGVSIISVPVGREYVPNAVVQGWRLARLIRKNRYDIVQTFHQKADTYGAVIARLSGVKHLISSKRDTGQLRKPWHLFLNRRLKSLFDAFIVVAEAVRVAVIANDHLPPSRITTIYNGVDVARFVVPSAQQRTDARTHLGFAADDFVVGMVAGFRPEKNHEVFFAGLLQAEIELVSPEVVVCLGATAAQALLGKNFKVTVERGRFVPGPLGRTYFATVHPSSILRAIDSDSRHRELGQFVADLKQVAKFLAESLSAQVSFL